MILVCNQPFRQLSLLSTVEQEMSTNYQPRGSDRLFGWPCLTVSVIYAPVGSMA